jgi:glycosyltransferase involved in cell wall biosynthesis
VIESNPSAEVELSAAIMVFNGRKTLERCLDALAFCDEICVVDDVSTDGTWEWLNARAEQDPKLRVFQHRHTTFGAQRQYVKDLTRGRWVLTIDADEYANPTLAEAIRTAIRRPDAPDGFYVRLCTPYPQGLQGARWSQHPRLVQRKKCHWAQDDSPHSPLKMEGLRFEVLSGGHMTHEPLEGMAQQLRKIINRNLIVAAQGAARGRRPGAWKIFSSALGRFFKAYVRQGGWRQGADGFVFACLDAFEGFTKYAFMRAHAPENATRAIDGGPGSYPDGTPILTEAQKR